MPDNSTTSFASCPAPLVFIGAGEGVGGTPCALPYRSLLWSASDWAEGDRLMTAFSSVSFISLCLILTTWTLFPSKRRQHHLHMFLLCQFIISLLFLSSLISTSSHSSNLGLDSFTESTTPTPTTTCIAQASLLVFFVNAGVFWWVLIAFHLFMKVVLHIRLTSQQHNTATLIYHVISWGVSLILTAVGGAKGWFGRSSVVPWCFFLDDAPAAADWLLFYIPIGVRGVVGMAMMLAVMVQLSRQSALTAPMRRRQGGCMRNVRPLLFIFQFLIIFFFLILFRAILYFNETHYTNATEAYVQCLLMGGVCGDKPVGGPTVSLFYLIIVVTAGQGLVPGLIYISQRGTLDLWKGLLTGQGLGGVSRTGRGESSVNTTSRVGGAGVMSANTAVRRMSQKAEGDKRKARKASMINASPTPANIAGTLQSSPTLMSSMPSGSPLPRHSLSSLDTIETHYAGVRISRSASPPVNEDGTASQRWYDTHQYRGSMVELATRMGEMGWREAGDSVGRAGRMEWTAETRVGVEVPERPPHINEAAAVTLPPSLPPGEGGAMRWSGVGIGVGLEGVGLGGMGVCDEEVKEEEGSYRVSLPLEE